MGLLCAIPGIGGERGCFALPQRGGAPRARAAGPARRARPGRPAAAAARQRVHGQARLAAKARVALGRLGLHRGADSCRLFQKSA